MTTLSPGLSARLRTLSALLGMDEEDTLRTALMDLTLEAAYLLGQTGSRDELSALKSFPRFTVTSEPPEAK